MGGDEFEALLGNLARGWTSRRPRPCFDLTPTARLDSLADLPDVPRRPAPV